MSLVTHKFSKKELRFLIKQRLSKLSPDSIQEQSSMIFNTITNNIHYQNAKRIGVYLSMPVGEVQTDSIVRNAFKCGKQVFIPFIPTTSTKKITENQQSLMDMVELHSLNDYESLKRDRWGIPSIDPNTFYERESIIQTSLELGKGLDVIFIPGVAFQIDSNSKLVKRLGHGKGYYDSFLNQYKANLNSKNEFSSKLQTLLYGLCFKEQLISNDDRFEVPVEAHDYSLHGLVIGNGKFYEAPSFQKED